MSKLIIQKRILLVLIYIINVEIMKRENREYILSMYTPENSDKPRKRSSIEAEKENREEARVW